MWVRQGRMRIRSTKNRGGSPINVRRKAAAPITPGRFALARKKLVSKIWLDTVLAEERDVLS